MAYETLEVFQLSEILPLIQKDSPSIELSGFQVSVNSLRLQLFKINQVCVCCDIVGDSFALQRTNKKDMRPHLNMYAGSMLMTKDHIIPKCDGGRDILKNLQTMCADCNCFKDRKVISIKELRELKEKYGPDFLRRARD